MRLLSKASKVSIFAFRADCIVLISSKVTTGRGPSSTVGSLSPRATSNMSNDNFVGQHLSMIASRPGRSSCENVVVRDGLRRLVACVTLAGQRTLCSLGKQPTFNQKNYIPWTTSAKSPTLRDNDSWTGQPRSMGRVRVPLSCSWKFTVLKVQLCML